MTENDIRTRSEESSLKIFIYSLTISLLLHEKMSSAMIRYPSNLDFLFKSETPGCSNFKYNSLFIVGFTLTFLKLPIYPSLT